MSSSAARYFPGVLARRNGDGAHEQNVAGSVDKLESCCEGGAVREAEISDEALLRQLQEKDISALGLLYRRYAKLVYSLSSRIIGDSAEAEDLVHEVFLSIYRRCGSFDPTKGSARSWLVQLTYHRCFDWRDYLRARHGFQQGSGTEKVPSTLPQFAEDPDPVEQASRLALVRDTFTRLSRKQQLAFKMRATGCSFSEIAERLGCSYGNAKNHFYRGMRRLREVVFDGNRPGRAPTARQGIEPNLKSAVQ